LKAAVGTWISDLSRFQCVRNPVLTPACLVKNPLRSLFDKGLIHDSYYSSSLMYSNDVPEEGLDGGSLQSGK
jgi:hypothetical protein